MKPAVLFVGHGSRDPEGTQEFCRLVEQYRASEPHRRVEHGFLEFNSPSIAEAVAQCAARGARTVAVLPGMLMPGSHVKNDIPGAMHEARQKYPDVEFYYGRHLHLHAKILELCRLRIEQSLAASRSIERRDTLLIVVSRGSNDTDANADISKLARMLAEGMGFGWSASAYSGVTTPLLPEALERCHRMGFARIVVFPFFLFTGVLEKRIRRLTAEFGQRHPETEFLCASYLSVHPFLLDAFTERAEEALRGSPI